jgi:hypothetical protein
VTTFLRELAKGSIRAIPHADLMMKLSAASSLMQSGSRDSYKAHADTAKRGNQSDPQKQTSEATDSTDDLSFDDLKQSKFESYLKPYAMN